MDIQVLADKINLNTKLKNKVLSLVDKDRAKLIYLCNIAKSGDFKSLFVKNDLTKLAIALCIVQKLLTLNIKEQISVMIYILIQ